MPSKENLAGPLPTSSRRKMILSLATTAAGLAVGSYAWSKPQQNMAEKPSTDEDKSRTSLHQEVDLNASPQRIYEILLDAKQFAGVTGAPAEIDPKPGGALSLFGGMISARNVELVPNQRIVQAWRSNGWDPGVYSIVKFELKSAGSQTKLILDHTGFPQGTFTHLYSGWQEHYLGPLKKHLG